MELLQEQLRKAEFDLSLGEENFSNKFVNLLSLPESGFQKGSESWTETTLLSEFTTRILKLEREKEILQCSLEASSIWHVLSYRHERHMLSSSCKTRLILFRRPTSTAVALHDRHRLLLSCSYIVSVVVPSEEMSQLYFCWRSFTDFEHQYMCVSQISLLCFSPMNTIISKSSGSQLIWRLWFFGNFVPWLINQCQALTSLVFEMVTQ